MGEVNIEELAPAAALVELQQQAAGFQQLLGMAAPPATGREAAQAATQFSRLLLSTVRPGPLLSQLVERHLAAAASRGAAAPPRFADVATGMRLRYLEWGRGREDTVLLLHGSGEAAEAWAPLATALAGRGYRVLALDLRGHGGSTWSGEGRYSVAVLADDVAAFISSLDLYVRPLALVGSGLGAAVGLALAQTRPALVASLAAVELGVPAVALQEAVQRAASDESSSSPEALGSAALLPWWGLPRAAGVEFESVEECAALLSHPLANVGPRALLPLLATAAAPRAGGGEEAGRQQTSAAEVLAALQRPAAGAVAAACAALRPPSGGALAAGMSAWGDPSARLKLRADPAFCATFDVRQLLAGMADLRCHLALLHGEKSMWWSAGDAAALAAMATGAAGAAAVALPGAGHLPASDHPGELQRAVVAFLEGPAAAGFLLAAGGADARRPELLRLRPLPQYKSLAEAQKALGPRAIPTPATIAAALRVLRVEEGGAGSDSDEGEEEGGRRQTALAKDPPEYFGFVG